MEKQLMKVTNLNLEPIVVKCLDEEEGQGWDLAFALRVETEYKRYLIMCQYYPDLPLVPSSDVDEFWHLHILDTQKYRVDCDAIFGGFLDHFPYFGMRGEEDEKNLAKAWAQTLEIYKMIFNQDPPADIWSKSKRCPNCGRRVKEDGSVYMLERPDLSSVLTGAV